MASGTNHLTCHISDFYPIAHFQELSNRVSKQSNNSKKNCKANISPREEIYKSMIREIKSRDISNMSSLVHKASGILRLTHHNELNKRRKSTVSWDIDGRKVISYDSGSGRNKTKLERQANSGKASKKTLFESLNEPSIGLHLDAYASKAEDSESSNMGGGGELRSEISKVWKDYVSTGDVTRVWGSTNEGLPKTDKFSCPQSSRVSTASMISDTQSSTRPPWKPFNKSSEPMSFERCNSWERTGALWNSYKSHTPSVSSLASSLPNRTPKILGKSDASKSADEFPNGNVDSADKIQNICVVNGSVVPFKDFGFENFTNWFGDESMLEANQQRCQPKSHFEVDLTDVENKNIKIRLLDGLKLEVDARRRLQGTTKTLRMKEVFMLPKGYKPEDLLMCRTNTGKLVIENITQDPIKSISFTTKTKRKGKKARSRNWKL